MPFRRTKSSGALFVGVFALMFLLVACAPDDAAEESDDAAEEPDDAAEEPDAPTDDVEEDDTVDEDVEQGEFTLTYTAFIPETNPHAVAVDWWLDEIENRTNGRVAVERFYAGTLCELDETVPCLQDGRADIGFSSAAWRPADFPVSEIMTVPFVTTDKQAAVLAYRDLLDEHEAFRSEHAAQQVRPELALVVGPAYVGSDEPIPNSDWFSGRTLRAVGHTALALEMSGAEPVQVATGEMYESLERGLIDAWSVFTFDGAVTNNLHEVTDHWVDPGLGIYATMNVWVSQQTWDELPEDVQGVIEEVSAEFHGGKYLEVYDENMAEMCQTALDAGVQLEAWSAEDTEAWRSDTQEAMIEAWIETAQELGADVDRGTWDDYVEAVQSHEPSGWETPTEWCN